MERRIFEKECQSVLFVMGLEKPPSWDGIMVKFFREFWLDIQEIIVLIANGTFPKVNMEKSILRGLIKLAP